MKTAFSSFIYSRRGIYGILHILILLMSLFLVISISIDTFHNIPFLNQGSYLKIQFWICMFFLFDFLLYQPFYQMLQLDRSRKSCGHIKRRIPNLNCF